MSLLRLLPTPGLKLLRKLMLQYGRRMDTERLLLSARRRAVEVAVRAARVCEAYRTLLRERGINLAALNATTNLATLPVLTKANTFGRFTLEQLARPLSPGLWADVLSSSGRSGRNFGYRITSRKQHDLSWFHIDLGLQDIFNVDEHSTLLVNCLPMGVVFSSRAVTVANVSVREDMACSILRDIGPRFKQTLLCTDPLFIRRLLDEARAAGVDWKALNTSVIMGEEVLVEAQRDFIAARMGIDIDHDPQRMIGSSFGVGELGLNLMFETRETIRICRALRAQPAVGQLFSGQRGAAALLSIFCFNPLRCHIEVLNPDRDGFGELCFTMLDPHAVIALPRYSTGDLGKLLCRHTVADAARLAGCAAPWLPVIALKGRIKDHPAGMPSVEGVKELIYSVHAVAEQITGAFRIARDHTGGVKLQLQTATERAARNPWLREQLLMLLELHQFQGLDLQLLEPLAFPDRPLLDHERKFSYMPSNPE